MMTIFRRLGVGLLLAGGAAAAQPYQSLAAIEARAAAQAGGAVRPVDPRLKLAACPEPLIAAGPVGAAVAVGCAPLGWRVRVAMVETPAAASPITIRRGDPVSVVITRPGFELRAEGLAQNDGRVGDHVRVRVNSEGAPLGGEVIDAGTVRAAN